MWRSTADPIAQFKAIPEIEVLIPSEADMLVTGSVTLLMDDVVACAPAGVVVCVAGVVEICQVAETNQLSVSATLVSMPVPVDRRPLHVRRAEDLER